MRVPTDSDVTGGGSSNGTEDQVTHGRPGAARITGSQAIISPRLGGGTGRGGLRGRTWYRNHHLDGQPVSGRDSVGSADTVATGGLAAAADEGHDAG